MATEDIEISVSLDGTDEAQAGTLALAQAIQALGAHVSALAPKVAQVQTAEERMAAAARAATAAQQAAATQAISFGQRLAGAASAVQGLVSQLGGQSRTAGLIGATLQTSVQFAQLGSALGPGGAVVGAIVGGLVPALRELINAQDDAAESARNLQAEELLLTERGQRMAEERRAQVESEVESGNILTLSEEEITRATALAAERRMAIYAQLQTVSHALRRAEEQGMDHTSGRFREWTAQAATLREELVSVTAQINNLDRATIGRSQAESEGANAETVAGARPSRGSGARRDPNQALYDIIGQSEDTANLGAQIEAEAVDRLNEALEAQLAVKQLLLEKDEERANQAATLHEAQLQFHEEELEREARAMEMAKEKAAEHSAVVTENINSTFSSIIGSMTNVITQIAEGNATAEEGAQMMLAAFLSTLSQMAQVQALAEVARAISDGASMNFGGMAGHIAGALAWGAVAVATGVGSAAVSSDVSKAQAARAEAERPASPRSSGTTEGKNGGTTVINFNGPVMTAQGEAQFGAMINRVAAVGAQRHPGGL